MTPPELRLIPFGPEHFTTLSRWFADEREVVQWGGNGVHFPLDAGQMQAMVDETAGDRPRRWCWMAALGDDLVGHAQLAFDWRHRTALIGRFGIAPAHRGRRLATPLMGLVLERAFTEAGMERAELNVFSFNTPAIAAYERAGFMREGVRRSCTAVDGERWDGTMMGILRAEYERAAHTSTRRPGGG